MPKVEIETVRLSEAEMMARMYEAVMGRGYERPAGMRAEEFIDRIPDKDQRADFVRAVRAAMLYVFEIVHRGDRSPGAHSIH
jgi:hypothetical protein